jgi:hypothetical protein
MIATGSQRQAVPYAREMLSGSTSQVLVPQQATFARPMMQRIEDLLRGGKMR